MYKRRILQLLGLPTLEGDMRESVLDALEQWPVSMSNSRMDFGNSVMHDQLEKKVARFVGKEAALVYTMSYNTNVVTLAALMGKGRSSSPTTSTTHPS